MFSHIDKYDEYFYVNYQTDSLSWNGQIQTVANHLHKSLNILIGKAKMEQSIEQQFGL